MLEYCSPNWCDCSQLLTSSDLLNNFASVPYGRAQTICVGAENPANASSFTECYLRNAGEVLPDLFSFYKLLRCL